VSLVLWIVLPVLTYITFLGWCLGVFDKIPTRAERQYRRLVGKRVSQLVAIGLPPAEAKEVAVAELRNEAIAVLRA
jgi:hypothetical protein